MGEYRAVVEFGTSKINCALAYSEYAGNTRIIGMGVAEYEGIKRGNWVSPQTVHEAVFKAVDDCERAAGRRIREVDVGIPSCFSEFYVGEATIPVTSKDGVISSEHVDQVIDRAARFEVPDEMSIILARPVYFMLEDGSYFLNPVERRSPSLFGKVAYTCVDNVFTEDMEYVFDGLKIAVNRFIPEPFAQAMYVVPPAERDVVAVLLDVGYYHSTVSIVHGDAVVYMATIYMGGVDIAEDLSDLFNIDLADAEVLKRRYSFGLLLDGDVQLKDYVKVNGRLMEFNHEYVQKIIDARVEYFATIIYNTIIESGVELSNRSSVFLTGGGVALMQGSRDFLGRKLNMPVHTAKSRSASHTSLLNVNLLAIVDDAFGQEQVDQPRSKQSFFARLLSFIRGK